ncbi:MAG: alpha-glucosidase [Lachnospiraceae bacterium]|nr:alpha-glucosidase [Lachnospiraceae bacterium]
MDKTAWWKEAVVYEIYPKSFQDSNGDGIGDLRGIIDRLAYVKALGADVIWLCPVYKSPMCDNGYDIADYYHVDPMFGSDEDMDELIAEAGRLGIKILMDLVVNHTSDEHEWFQKALEDPCSKYADYYVFRDGRDGEPPNNWRSYFGGSAWERIGDSNRFYLHIFDKKQPDLNWECEELRKEIYKIINYWLDKGLAGFRIDAISNIKKNIRYGTFPPDGEDGLCYIGDWVLNQPGIENFLQEMNERTFMLHDSMTVAEANVPDELLDKFIGENGFFSMVFDFSYTDIDVPESGEWYQPTNWTVKEMREKIFHSQMAVNSIGWAAPYLENHDQPRSINKYIPRQYINDYSKTMLGGLFMMLKGTPFIYQGEELGMENIRMDSIRDYDDIATFNQYSRAVMAGMTEEEALNVVYLRSRDNSRTPMQWDTSKNAGFSDSDHTWLKVNPNYLSINAEHNAVLEFYKKIIALRKSTQYADVVVYGRFVPIENTVDNVIAYERIQDERYLMVICNFQPEECEMLLHSGYSKILLSNYENGRIEDGKIHLRPFECAIIAKGFTPS